MKRKLFKFSAILTVMLFAIITFATPLTALAADPPSITVDDKGGVATGVALDIDIANLPADHDVAWTVKDDISGEITFGDATSATTTVTSTAAKTATIVATLTPTASGDPITLEAPVKFTTPITKIDVTNKVKEVAVGRSITATAAITPDSDTVNKNLVWTSGDTSIATVDAKTGVITGVKAGTVTITATAEDGTSTAASASFTVVQYVNSVTVKGTGDATTVPVGGNLTMLATLDPNVSGATVNWEVKNGTGEATIGPDGKLAGVKAGEVEVIATVNDSNAAQGSAKISVIVPATSVAVTPKGAVISLEKPTVQLTATIAPANSTDVVESWEIDSQYKDIASVDEKGLVTINKDIKKGATITVTAITKGGKIGTTTVVVVGNVKTTKIELTKGSNVGASDWESSTIKIADKDVHLLEAHDGNKPNEDPAKATLLNGANINAEITPNDADSQALDYIITGDKQDSTFGKKETVSTNGKDGKLSIYGFQGAKTVFDVKAKAKDGSAVESKAFSFMITKKSAANSLQITNTETYVKVGKDLQMKSKFADSKGVPVNTTDVVQWSTDDTSIATIDKATGILKGVKEGSVTVTAKSYEVKDTAFSTATNTKTYTISVVNAMTDIKVAPTVQGTKPVIHTSGSLGITATVLPDTIANPAQYLDWEIIDPNETGATLADVVGKPLEKTITAGTKAGIITVEVSTKSTYPYTVIGELEISIIKPITKVQILGSSKIGKNTTELLSTRLTPADAEPLSVEWAITDGAEFATINSKTGDITALDKEGTVTVEVKVTDADDHVISTTKEIQIVNIATEEIKISADKEVLEGKELPLNVEFTPANASNKVVTWEINKAKSTGDATFTDRVFVGTKPGNVVFYAVQTVEGGDDIISNEITVKVNENILVKTITVSGATEVVTGKTAQMTANVLPANAINKAVDWKVDDTKVATINASGVLTAVREGNVTVTATAKDGSKVFGTAKVKVTGVPVVKVESITLTGNTQIAKGATTQLTANVLPANAANKAVAWSVSDASIATVDSNGVVTGIKGGSVVVTAAAVDGSNVKATTTVTVTEKIDTPVEAFVERLYVNVLGRASDPEKANYVSALTSGKATGASTAYGFVFSDELTNKNLNDEAFITMLYKAFFGRTPSASEVKGWKEVADLGVSRKYLFSQFVGSDEYKKMCAAAGISAGSYASDEARDQNSKVTAFVQRFYDTCLYRKGDVTGLNDWTAALNTGNATGAQVGSGFVLSKEYTDKNKSNAEYVADLYKAFFGRAGDPAGTKAWTDLLASGTTRFAVLAGFVNSTEFNLLCADYGIKQGNL